MLDVWEAVRLTCWRFWALTGSIMELRLQLLRVMIEEEGEGEEVLDQDMVEEVVVGEQEEEREGEQCQGTMQQLGEVREEGGEQQPEVVVAEAEAAREQMTAAMAASLERPTILTRPSTVTVARSRLGELSRRRDPTQEENSSVVLSQETSLAASSNGLMVTVGPTTTVPDPTMLQDIREPLLLLSTTPLSSKAEIMRR